MVDVGYSINPKMKPSEIPSYVDVDFDVLLTQKNDCCTINMYY